MDAQLFYCSAKGLGKEYVTADCMEIAAKLFVASLPIVDSIPNGVVVQVEHDVLPTQLIVLERVNVFLFRLVFAVQVRH